MRTFQSAESLLTPYQQKQRDKLTQHEASQTQPEQPAQQPAETSQAEDTSREGILDSFPKPGDQQDQQDEQDNQDPPESPQKPPEPATSNDAAAEETKLLDAIYETERRIIDLAGQEKALADELCGIREELTAERDTKDHLLSDLPGSLIAIRQGETAGAIVDGARQAAQQRQSTPVLTWQSKPTRELAEGTEGLGKEKMDALCDKYPTAGDLENARTAANEMKQHFSSQLPRGCGKKIANQLEERLITLATNHDTPPASEQVKENQQEIELLTEEIAEDSQTIKLIRSIERSLRASMSEPGSLDGDGELWNAGYTIFEHADSVEACPESEAERITEWMKGWLTAELLADQKTIDDWSKLIDEAKTLDQLHDVMDQCEEACHELNADAREEITKRANAAAEKLTQASDAEPEAEADEAAEPEAEPEQDPEPAEPGDHIERMEAIVAEVKAGGDTRREGKNPHWAEGHEAAIDGFPVESCPSSLSHDDAIQYVRGWIFGSSFQELL